MGHTNRVHCARYSPTGKTIASCSEDRTLKLFDVASGDCVHTYNEYNGGYGTEVAWHPDGTLIAIALTNNRIKIYDRRNHRLIQLYSVHLGAVNSIAFHPHGNLMITGSEDGSTKILDLLEGRPVYTLVGHDDAVTAVAFSSDGSHFATGSKDKQVKFDLIVFIVIKITFCFVFNSKIMVWKLNMEDQLAIGADAGPRYSLDNDENVNQENMLDESIMVDPRKMKAAYKLDDYEMENFN